MPPVIAVGAAYLLAVPSENRGSFPRTTMTTATTRAELEREEQKKPIERAGDYSLFSARGRGVRGKIPTCLSFLFAQREKCNGEAEKAVHISVSSLLFAFFMP